MKKLRTVGLLAREPGLRVLEEALLPSPMVDLLAVYTHARCPKLEGGGPRPERAAYQTLCTRANVPLIALDYADSHLLEDLVRAHQADLLLALSWRTILSAGLLASVKTAVNLHRGALPDFAGAFPVQRAIEAGMSRVAITAHHMVEQVDTGPTIAMVWMDIAPPPPTDNAAAYAERVKERLLPLYAPLALLALSAVATQS